MIKQFKLVTFIFSMCFFLINTSSAFNLNGFLNDVIEKTSDSILNPSSEPTQRQPVYTPPAKQSTTKKNVYDYPSKNPTQVKQAPKYDRQLVADIQNQLNTNGYQVGAPDGIYGNKTRQAIEQFQNDNGLKVNGIPEHSLLNQLEQLTKNRKSQDASMVSSVNNQTTPPIIKDSDDSRRKNTLKPVVASVIKHAPEDFDIKGLRLNMSLAEIKEKLNNLLPTVSENQQKYAVQGTKIEVVNPALTAMNNYGPGHEGYIVSFPMLPNPDKAIVIHRTKNYTKETAPSKKTLTMALIKKYGDYSFKLSGVFADLPGLRGPHALVWAFDVNGNLVKLSQNQVTYNLSQCDIADGVSIDKAKFGLGRLRSRDLYKKGLKECPKYSSILFVRIHTGSKGNVRALKTTLVNHHDNAIYLGETFAYADEKNNQLIKAAQTKADSNTPDL